MMLLSILFHNSSIYYFWAILRICRLGVQFPPGALQKPPPLIPSEAEPAEKRSRHRAHAPEDRTSTQRDERASAVEPATDPILTHAPRRRPSRATIHVFENRPARKHVQRRPSKCSRSNPRAGCRRALTLP